MIARLRGRIWEKGSGALVLDVNGVGYEVHVTSTTLATVGPEGQTADLNISTQVREDSITLYGFVRPEERMLFEMLIGVSGIGPTKAIGALSATTPSDLAVALAGGDLVRLSRLPGIGKKTAERLVVELRDKIDALRATLGATAGVPGGARGDALAALLTLGYTRQQAEAALDGVGDGNVQDLIKTALQRLSTRS